MSGGRSHHIGPGGVVGPAPPPPPPLPRRNRGTGRAGELEVFDQEEQARTWAALQNKCNVLRRLGNQVQVEREAIMARMGEIAYLLDETESAERDRMQIAAVRSELEVLTNHLADKERANDQCTRDLQRADAEYRYVTGAGARKEKTRKVEKVNVKDEMMKTLASTHVGMALGGGDGGEGGDARSGEGEDGDVQGGEGAASGGAGGDSRESRSFSLYGNNQEAKEVNERKNDTMALLARSHVKAHALVVKEAVAAKHTLSRMGRMLAPSVAQAFATLASRMSKVHFGPV